MKIFEVTFKSKNKALYRVLVLESQTPEATCKKMAILWAMNNSANFLIGQNIGMRLEITAKELTKES